MPARSSRSRSGDASSQLPPILMCTIGRKDWAFMVARGTTATPTPRQFVSLSKQKTCKRGSSELLENVKDSKGQKGQNKKGRGAALEGRRRNRAAGRSGKALRGSVGTENPHAYAVIYYLIVCQCKI